LREAGIAKTVARSSRLPQRKGRLNKRKPFDYQRNWWALTSLRSIFVNLGGLPKIHRSLGVVCLLATAWHNLRKCPNKYSKLAEKGVNSVQSNPGTIIT
jgi:hypothetical protein